MTAAQRDGSIISAELFEELATSGAACLKTNKKTVNDLNVFPIPDGDTGDNMYMTLQGGLSYLKSETDGSLASKSEALANGMILNARGNSGVILSQFFSGIAKGLSGISEASTRVFAEALAKGVNQAYKAVVTPVEGTVLTVAREATEYALSHLEENLTIKDFFRQYVEQMKLSLDKTPELLEVLAEAGVVDSGGAGLLVIFEGMLAAMEGQSYELSEDAGESAAKALDFSKFDENSVMTFGYCTELLLRLQTSKVENPKDFDIQIIIDYLSTVGDSIAAFLTGTIVKIHVHTLTPYKVLEFCQRFGEFLTVKIENMTLQHNETDESFAGKSKPADKPENKPADKKEESSFRRKRQRRPFALVTVASGAGLSNTFLEFGADFVIDGGQTKNPSVEDFISAFDEVNADDVFVLPNNSNIILAAKGARDIYKDSRIHVIETKSFGEAYSILSMLDYSSGDAEAIAEEMQENMKSSVTGMVTTSIRSVTLDGVKIEEGDYIGFSGKTMLVSEKTPIDAFKQLSKKLCAAEREFMIVFFGDKMTDADMNEAERFVSDTYPNVEYYAVHGCGEVYNYIVILE